MNLFSDEYFMGIAIKEAETALEKGEIPIGAIIVLNNEIIAKSHNLTEKLNDITAHAEIQAITSASNFLNSKYLKNCTIYITLEPCTMCCGALYWSQINRVVYSSEDKKRGGLSNGIRLHPKTIITKNILKQKTSLLLKDFFSKKR